MLRNHLAVLVALGALSVFGHAEEPKKRVRPTPQDLWTTTADGARLYLERHRSDGPAVLLVHGLAANTRIFTVPELKGNGVHYWSLTQHLHERGYDVWLVNLRGAGRGKTASLPPAGHPVWTIDDHAVEDVPATLQLVRRTTGKRPLVVGHSLGALSTLIYLEGARWRHELEADGETGPRVVELDPDLARQRQAEIRGICLLSAPVRMTWQSARPPRWIRLAKKSPKFLSTVLPRRIPLGKFAFNPTGELPPSLKLWKSKLESARGNGNRFIQRWTADQLLEITFGPARNRPAIIMTKIREGILNDCSRGVLLQFLDGIRAATIRSGAEPRVDYTAGYPMVKTLMLVLTGAKDRVVDAQVVAETLRLAESSDKTDRRIVATLPGFGHTDVLLGAYAPHEVYPRVEKWLRNCGED